MRAGAMHVTDHVVIITRCFAGKLTSRKLRFYRTDILTETLFEMPRRSWT